MVLDDLAAKYDLGQQICISKYQRKGIYQISKEKVESVEIIDKNVIYNNKYYEAVCFETELLALISIHELILNEAAEEAILWNNKVKLINEAIAALSTGAAC